MATANDNATSDTHSEYHFQYNMEKGNRKTEAKEKVRAINILLEAIVVDWDIIAMETYEIRSAR